MENSEIDYRVITFKIPVSTYRHYKLLAAKNFEGNKKPDRIGELYIQALEEFKNKNVLE